MLVILSSTYLYLKRHDKPPVFDIDELEKIKQSILDDVAKMETSQELIQKLSLLKTQYPVLIKYQVTNNCIAIIFNELPLLIWYINN